MVVQPVDTPRAEAGEAERKDGKMVHALQQQVKGKRLVAAWQVA